MQVKDVSSAKAGSVKRRNAFPSCSRENLRESTCCGEKRCTSTLVTPLAAAPVNKALAFEQGVEITVREVKYTPVAADRNLAMARITVRHGSETKDVSLGRELPGGKVCYQLATGVWVGLVETVPNKAMLRVGLPPAEPPP